MVHIKYDSILTAQDTNVVNTSAYYKTGEELPDHDIAMVEHPYSAAKDDVVLCGIMLSILTIAILTYRGRTFLSYRIKEFFSTKRTYSEEDVNTNDHEIYSTFFLTCISALSITLVIFNQISEIAEFDRTIGIPYWIFAVGYIVVIGFIYLKAWLYSLINWTFFHKDANIKWMSGYLLLTSLLAFIALPVSLISVLVENGHEFANWTFLIMVFLYEILLFFKLLVNFGGKIYGYVLLFLYFCTLEIMPTLILYRTYTWALHNFIVKILN